MPPTIPTSFVPKQPVEMHPRHSESGGNMFMVASAVIFGIVLLLSIGVFAYGHYLEAQSAQKAADLKTAESAVNVDTVDDFLRFRNRLVAAQTVLDQHVTLSQFFDVLESITLTDVRFSGLNIAVADDHSATIKMTGTAQTFNALAAQSAAFAQQPLIKQAIFSGISADAKGVVSFSLSATLDPRLVEIPATVPASWTASSTTTSLPPANASSTQP